jgi:hypothetical protein
MLDPMEGPARTRLVALVMLLAVAVPLTVVAIAGSGGGPEGDEPALRVQRSPQIPELIVFVEPEDNVPERARGRDAVTVECLAAGGEVIAGQTEAWPLTETDRGTLDPHVHVPVNPARIDDVEMCRVRPARPPLEGPVS